MLALRYDNLAGVEARTSAEHLECERNGSDGADQEERPANGFALAQRQAIRQQEAKPGRPRAAPRANEQGKFRQGHLDFSHSTDPLGSSWYNTKRLAGNWTFVP